MQKEFTVDYRRLLELSNQLAAKIEELHTFYLDSIAGYLWLYKKIISEQDRVSYLLGERSECAGSKCQDDCSVTYKELCGKNFVPVSFRATMKQGDVKKRARENGENYLLLGDLCLVSAYSYWDEYLRIEIGIAKGFLAKGSKKAEAILRDNINNDFWGDMRLLRNSIIHNDGKAITEVKNCKIIKYFQPGQKIELDYKKMRAIFLLIGKYINELLGESFPPRKTFKVPSV